MSTEFERTALVSWRASRARRATSTRLRFPTRDLLIVNSPEAMHEVLVSKAKAFEKSPLIRLVLYPLAGEGLFTAGGALWRRQRRLMAPVFHHAKIDALAPVDGRVRRARVRSAGATATSSTSRTRPRASRWRSPAARCSASTPSTKPTRSATRSPSRCEWADHASHGAADRRCRWSCGSRCSAAPHVPARLRPTLERVADAARAADHVADAGATASCSARSRCSTRACSA